MTTSKPKRTKGAATTESLRGLGPKSLAALAAIGVHSAPELRRRDPFEVYAALKARDPATSLNFLYALIGAVENVHWLEIKRTRRSAILLRLDEMGLAPR
jgi:DNA transformation protein and related proteins